MLFNLFCRSVPVILVIGMISVVSGGSVSAQGAPPAMPVSVAQPVKRNVVNWIEFSGRFEASALVEIRAQISGVLEQVHFKDGQEIKKGSLLFVVDPRPFEAALRQAQANLEISRTRVDLANSELERAKGLKKTGNIPESTYQIRQQAALEAKGGLQAAQATAEKAQLDLDYTQIRAPISGRIGEKNITEGNLISSGSSGAALTTIVTYDPIHFYFDIDEQSYLTYQRNVGTSSQSRNANVHIALSDEADFSHEGTLDFLSNQFDSATGTIRARATVPNKDGLLTPRMFGRIRLAASGQYEALVVPDSVVVTDQSRKLVLTVAQDGTVQPRPVELGPKVETFRIIRSGLKGDENIIVNGMMRARPGSKVMPQTTQLQVPEDLTQASLSK
jgi:RND family efflux transporter MFP subunit